MPKNTTMVRSVRTPATMRIKRALFPELTESSFRLLTRIAVLTGNGSHPCNYTNAQAEKEFNMNSRATERAFKQLRDRGYISISKEPHLTHKAGLPVRTIRMEPAFSERRMTPAAAQSKLPLTFAIKHINEQYGE